MKERPLKQVTATKGATGVTTKVTVFSRDNFESLPYSRLGLILRAGPLSLVKKRNSAAVNAKPKVSKV